MEGKIQLSEKVTELMNEEDIGMLRTLESKFGELMLGHSKFQIKNFIVGQFLTPDRKHRQCLHELWARYNALVSVWYETKKLQLEVRRLELERCQVLDELSKQTPVRRVSEDFYQSEKLQIKKDGIDLDLTHTKLRLSLSTHSLRETLREIRYFFQLYNELGNERKWRSYEEAEEEYWKMKGEVRKMIDK